jgi:hypothetical protein
MSQSKIETTLKPIENILESLKEKSSISNYTTTSQPSYSSITKENITSSLTFKIIIILIILLLGIVGYTYLEKEVNELIANIKNYFETKKYTNKEKEKQKEIENENTSKEQTVEDVMKDVQSDIKKNKNNKNEKNKKEEPVNYSPSSKLNSSPIQDDLEEYQKDSLQKALNDASQSGGEVISDNAESRIQSGKSGWCFIGSEGLSRTCAEIGVNDICMSGEIYPTKDVCINPKLRA